MALEPVGVRLEAAGEAQYNAALKRAEQATAKLGDAAMETAQEFTRQGGDLGQLSGTLDQYIKRLKAATPENAKLALEAAHVTDEFESGKISASEAAKALEKIQKQAKGSTQEMSTFGKGMQMLKPMITGLIAMFAFDRVKDFFVGAVQKASDLNETLNKSSVVFGKYAGEIEAMGRSSADSMGMSKNASVAAAATYGNLFTTLGLGQKEAAGMSARLVQLAADQGSFNNLPTAEILEKIRAGLVGEGEPLKVLGINISETTLKQEALNLGLTKGNAPLSAATKAQAAYSLMIKQSANANGDYLRTADGAANSTKSLQARTEDLTAEIGAGLLPAWSGILKVLNEAIKTFNLLRTRQATMDDTVKDHEETMRKTAKTYEEYITEMRRAIAVANGFKNFQEYTGYMRAHGLSIEEVYKQYGIADRLGYEYAQMVGKVTVKVKENTDATLRMANSQETYLAHIQAEDVNRQNNWTAALAGATYQANLADQAMQGFTRAVLLNMMGLEKGSSAWWAMALDLGVVSQKEYETAQNIMLWDKALAEGKINRDQYIEGLHLIAAGQNAIPDVSEKKTLFTSDFDSDWLRDNLYTWGLGNRTFTVTTKYEQATSTAATPSQGGTSSQYYGTSETTTTSTGTTTGRNVARAGGGRIMAGWPYWVGEKGPEPFIPSLPGYILSKADAERIYATQVAASIISPMVSAGPSNYSYSTANNYNLSVMTSQSPQVVQRSFAIMKLLAG